MNIESTSTATVSKSSENTSSASATATKEASKSFKEELETTKTQETKEAQATEAQEEANKSNNAQKAESEKTQKAAEEKRLKENVVKEEETAQALKETSTFDPLKELNAKIEMINTLKGQNSTSKIEETSLKSECFCSMKMDKNDITFFISLVENQQSQIQNIQGMNTASIVNNYSDIKNEAIQQTVQVSATLLNALNEAAKTGKSFRIDFDGDIAVIMKVDKEGVISANFIPGSAAVEAYLRNNIAGLRQNFDNQNLAYSELTYTKQQKQEQENQQKNNKENENE